MPRFTYRAYDADGVLQTGELSASSRTGALEALARRAILPIEVRAGSTGPTLPWWQRDVFGARSWPARDLSIFTRELATLTSASIPLDEALQITALQPLVKPRLREATSKILEGVTEGQSLSQALQLQSPAFPEYYCRLVEAGESVGSLSEALEDLARFTEQSADVRARVRASLFYPAVLLFAALCAFAVIAGVLIPAIQPIFEDAKVDPPWIIRTMTSATAFVSENFAFVTIAAALAGLGLIAAHRSPEMKLQRDRVLLGLPLVGSLIAQSETARFSRTLAAMLRNGVPVVEAMQTSAGVLSSAPFSMAVRDAATAIKEGATLIAPLAKPGIFPELFVRLAGIGERTGQLHAMLTRVAVIYDASVQRGLERLTNLVTPVLTLIIGAVVGTLILSVMNALVSVNELALQ